MSHPHIAIISPAMANANNGNWQTASRWTGFLQESYRVTLASVWDGAPVDAMVALHARRSAASIRAFAGAYPDLPLIVVLTGTDLYRDIRTDADAQHSLQCATRLVLLNEAALRELPQPLRHKAVVILQSALPSPARKETSNQDVVMIGHLREEKDPRTFMRAAAMVPLPQARFLHIGGALDPVLGSAAEAAQRDNPRYQWLGNLPHDKTRECLAASRLMVLTSRMEGGAHVLVEALVDGVPVLASDIAGNRGILGEDYAGYFPVGDATSLAGLIDRAFADAGFHALLKRQCATRAPLFSPAREKAALLHLLDNVRNFPGT